MDRRISSQRLTLVYCLFFPVHRTGYHPWPDLAAAADAEPPLGEEGEGAGGAAEEGGGRPPPEGRRPPRERPLLETHAEEQRGVEGERRGG
jgi:hypothetical protein